jgi:cytochrome b6-f complex iron-sulfur subunit
VARDVTRRSVLRAGWKIGGGLLVAAAGWTSYELLRPLTSTAAGGKIKVGNKADFAVGTAKYFAEGRLYVSAEKDPKTGNPQLFALAQKCPHLGCRVPFCDSSGRFECNCHGSVFNAAGEWIQGPAPRGMDRHPLAIDDLDNVTVDTSKTITGPDHGSALYPTTAKGPACTGSNG